MGGKAWSQEERDFVMGFVGFEPLCSIHKRHQMERNSMGWPERSIHSIRARINSLEQSSIPIYQNWPAAELDRLLGYGRGRVAGWIRRGLLKAKRTDGGWGTIITDKALSRFAEKYPHLLAEADLSGLEFLFGLERAKEIKSIEYRAWRKPRRYRCTETGAVFQSGKHLRRSLKIYPEQIQKLVAAGKLERLDDD